MIGALKNMRDQFFGAGEYSVTVPPLDGQLRSNSDLEKAATLIEVSAPDHLQVQNGKLWFASGRQIFCYGPKSTRLVQEYETDITAFAISPAGEMAVALADGTLILPFTANEPDEGRNCVTSISFAANGSCYLTVGSNQNPAAHWQKDVMERQSAGSLWALAKGEARKIVSGLAWPCGVMALADGSVLVSEASKHRIFSFDLSGQGKLLIGDLPGYPAGITPLSGGGFATCLMAPRNQLIEFILREPQFCQEMVATIAPEHWIAPSLRAPTSFLEPLQGGALKQLGKMKPWAPSRSGGIVITLNDNFVPTRSFHSRADGQNHGTTSVAEFGGALVVASRSAGRILRIPIGQE